MLRVLARVALIPTLFIVGTIILGLLSTSVAYGAINPQISFQGKLTNTDGTNVTNGAYSIVFSMYTVASGGSAIWTETQPAVQVTDGIFQVNLGSVTALPGSVDFNSGSVFLGVKVGADPEMAPRILFTASPYAFNSNNLGGLASTGFVQLAQGVQADGSTTNASIAINKTGATAKLMDLQRGGVSVFNINNDGSTLIKNSADSATEFLVQDSSSLPLFTIDSTANRLYVGNTTADAANILLVLDTAASAPTGVNGGTYYDSTLNKFRCFQNSIWQDCITRNRVTLGADVINNNAVANTIADVTGLSFAVISGAKYQFECNVWYTSAATTTGSRWSINGPTTTSLAYTSIYTLTATTNTSNSAVAYNIPAASNASSANTTGNNAIIQGFIQPSANGTVIVRFASEIANSAITAKAGSSCEYWTP